MIIESERTTQDKLEFLSKYKSLTNQYEEQKNSLDKVVKEKAYKTGKTTKMRAYLEAMKKADNILKNG